MDIHKIHRLIKKKEARMIKIGTRGSPLALAQAYETREKIAKAHTILLEDIQIIIMQTTGDRIQDRPLSEIGGKGLFTKELEEGLLSGDLDLAVHSAKDMPTILPEGLMISTYLEREDRSDALISAKGQTIEALPENAVIGSASLRRGAMVKYIRPDIQVNNLRGNVATRLKKLSDGICDATFLAMAGLKRLNIQDDRISALDPEIFLPAPGQGAICIEINSNNHKIQDILAPLDHSQTHVELLAERAFLGALDGSCRTPIAALTKIDGQNIQLKGLVMRPDGTDPIEAISIAKLEDARQLGEEMGLKIKAQMSENYWAGI